MAIEPSEKQIADLADEAITDLEKCIDLVQADVMKSKKLIQRLRIGEISTEEFKKLVRDTDMFDSYTVGNTTLEIM